jgi:hypothetical protein
MITEKIITSSLTEKVAAGIAGSAKKMVHSPLTKKIAVTVAGAVVSYVTQIYVGKAYDSVFETRTDAEIAEAFVEKATDAGFDVKFIEPES